MDFQKTVLTLNNVSKSFADGNGTVRVLSNISFSVYEGESVAIIGPSGSGKSTLLALLSGLEKETEGELLVDGQNLSLLSEKELGAFRNKTIGIIFQSFELIGPFTVRENITAPLDLAGKKDEERVDALLERVGLTHRGHNFPKTLSGGEKQRVAIARALVHSPRIIFADEPTGSLDRETGKKVLELLLEEIRKEGKTLLLITHDLSIAEKMDRVFEIKDGTLYEQS